MDRKIAGAKRAIDKKMVGLEKADKKIDKKEHKTEKKLKKVMKKKGC